MDRLDRGSLSAPIEKLVQLAEKYRTFAYAPYSRFRVGAALIDEREKVFSGANVENAVYGAGICAERVAINSMVVDGGKEIQSIVVATYSKQPAFPCGLCLQVINEFCQQTQILTIGQDPTFLLRASFSEAFPHAFGRKLLEQGQSVEGEPSR